MRGIVLAGGLGSRMGALTRVVNKHLLPVYDRPMISYPLETLQAMDVTQVDVITRPEDQGTFCQLLADESVSLAFLTQKNPRGGIAEALVIDFDSQGHPQPTDPVALILGDNLFLGDGMNTLLREPFVGGARIFVTSVPRHDIGSLAVLEVDADRRPVAIEEKPADPRSDLAVTGLYVFDGRVGEVARALRPSARGELEIADVIRWYLERGELEYRVLPPSVYWADLGTPDRLLRASCRIEVLRQRMAVAL